MSACHSPYTLQTHFHHRTFSSNEKTHIIYIMVQAAWKQVRLQHKSFSNYLKGNIMHFGIATTLDLPLQGVDFTLSSNQDNPTMSRLDHFLLSGDWGSLWHAIRILRLRFWSKTNRLQSSWSWYQIVAIVWLQYFENVIYILKWKFSI